jgi:hypothetical protein
LLRSSLRQMGDNKMKATLHPVWAGLLAAMATVGTLPAQALEFGAWQVNLADIAHYSEPGAFVETPAVCTAIWVGQNNYLLVALLPGGERLVQASDQDWNIKEARGAGSLAIGGYSLALEDAVYGRQFADHVASGAEGDVSGFETLAETVKAMAEAPTSVQFLDGSGSILVDAPFAGFLEAIDGLLACRRVVYGE